MTIDWKEGIFHLPSEGFTVQRVALFGAGLVIHQSGICYHLRHAASGALYAKAYDECPLQCLSEELTKHIKFDSFDSFDSMMCWHNRRPDFPDMLFVQARRYGCTPTIVERNNPSDRRAAEAVAEKNREAV